MRIEYKYLLDNKNFELLKAFLPLYFDFDNFSTNEGYLVSSLYYDSSDLKSFYEKDNGDLIKRKWRIRGYNNLASTAHLEEKIKSGIYSRKNIYPTDHVFTLPLEPKLKVEYRRLAFGKDDLRLTLDDCITFSREPALFSHSGVSVGMKVFEVKTFSEIAHPVVLKLISDLQLECSPFSKYGHGMRLLYGL